MADDLEYHLLDVFTATPFTGNALAVFVDPPELTDAQMQAIASELHLSETVFVRRPADGPAWAARIFTPDSELPFAGHPTVGTALLLAELGLVDDAVVLREAVGDVACVLEGGRATLTSPRLPEPTPADAPDVVAAAVGLVGDDLHPTLPVGSFSCGVPFTFVPVCDRKAVARAQVGAGASDVQYYVVAPLDDSFTTWHARMFAPGLGIPEDPATGAAAAAFAGLLAPLGVMEVVIAQGVEMGRPSEIYVSLDRNTGGELTAVRVGGQAVVVGSGRLRVPEHVA